MIGSWRAFGSTRCAERNRSAVSTVLRTVSFKADWPCADDNNWTAFWTKPATSLAVVCLVRACDVDIRNLLCCLNVRELNARPAPQQGLLRFIGHRRDGLKPILPPLPLYTEMGGIVMLLPAFADFPGLLDRPLGGRRTERRRPLPWVVR